MSTSWSMYNDFVVDSRLQSAEYDSAVTPFECMLKAKRSAPQLLIRDTVEQLCDVDAAALENAMGLNVPLMSDPFFDCGLPEVGNCHPNPVVSQCPVPSLPSPVSLMHPTGSPIITSPLIDR